MRGPEGRRVGFRTIYLDEAIRLLYYDLPSPLGPEGNHNPISKERFSEGIPHAKRVNCLFKEGADAFTRDSFSGKSSSCFIHPKLFIRSENISEFTYFIQISIESLVRETEFLKFDKR